MLFFFVVVVLRITMYVLNISRGTKKMSVNELRDFTFEKKFINELDLLKKDLII